MPAPLSIRPAVPSDYATFARLFPELGVDDARPDEEKFVREMAPTTLIAERDGVAVGIAHYLVLGAIGYVRMLITDPAARRTGIGRRLMTALQARFREAGSTEWALNVFPGNAAAIALYESFGMKRAERSRKLRFPWRLLDGEAAAARRRAASPARTARAIEPEDDARVEREMKIIPGLFADARAKGGRVLRMIEERGDAAGGEVVVGASIFDPSFPGAYAFRARSFDVALALLEGLRPDAREGDEVVHIVLEDQPDVADALVAFGATFTLETMRMRGAIR